MDHLAGKPRRRTSRRSATLLSRERDAACSGTHLLDGLVLQLLGRQVQVPLQAGAELLRLLLELLPPLLRNGGAGVRKRKLQI